MSQEGSTCDKVVKRWALYVKRGPRVWSLSFYVLRFTFYVLRFRPTCPGGASGPEYGGLLSEEKGVPNECGRQSQEHHRRAARSGRQRGDSGSLFRGRPRRRFS